MLFLVFRRRPVTTARPELTLKRLRFVGPQPRGASPRRPPPLVRLALLVTRQTFRRPADHGPSAPRNVDICETSTTASPCSAIRLTSRAPVRVCANPPEGSGRSSEEDDPSCSTQDRAGHRYDWRWPPEGLQTVGARIESSSSRRAFFKGLRRGACSIGASAGET